MQDVANVVFSRVDRAADDGNKRGKRHRIHDIEIFFEAPKVPFRTHPERQIVLDDGHAPFFTGFQGATMDASPFIHFIGDVFVAFHDLVVAVIGPTRDDQNVMSTPDQGSGDIVNGKLLGIEELAHDENFHVLYYPLFRF